LDAEEANGQAAAAAWLADGRVKVEGLFSIVSPEEAQAVYSSLFERRSPAPTAVFDWRKLGQSGA
jgi:hypothetical protein